MNAEKRKKVAESINKINAAITKQMMNPEKNGYDPELKMPSYVHTVAKKFYNVKKDTSDNAKNKKRRENRPNALEQCILCEKNKEAEDRIRKQYYTTLTDVSKQKKCYCDEKTARKIMQQMFAMIGHKVEMIPNALVNETTECIRKWTTHANTLYQYNRNKIKPLDMTQEEMSYVYDTYILTKKIILLNSVNKETYDENVEKLNKELSPIYAAIRELRKMQ
jgi:hypothetical protein